MASISDEERMAVELAKKLVSGQKVPEGFASGGKVDASGLKPVGRNLNGIPERDAVESPLKKAEYPYHLMSPKTQKDAPRIMQAINRAHAASKVMPVKIKDLVTDVDAIGRSKVMNPSTDSEPFVEKIGGTMHLRDGNHRVAHAMLSGKDTVQARVADMSELLPPVERSLGGRLALQLAAKGRKLAGPPAPTGSKYMPGVPRAVAARGGKVLYSKAAEVAEGLPQDAGTVDQMLAMLRKRGVKPAELEHAGRPEGDKITRSELAAHFRKNMPTIRHRQYTDEGEDGEDMRQYEEYVAPGRASNYREHLLTLPDRGTDAVEAIRKRKREINDASRAAIDAGDNEAWDRLNREYKDLDPKHDAALDAQKVEQYKSSHWREPNVAAHIRTTDRPGGVLNVEEIQSDWGQEGRNTGFRPAGSRANAMQEAEDVKRRFLDTSRAYDDAVRARHASSKNVWDTYDRVAKEMNGEGHPDQHPDYLKAEEEHGKAVAHEHNMEDAYKVADKAYADGDFHDAIHDRRPPEAPYVTNTGHWVDLALKHVLHEAVRGDYDHVSFNPGSANNEMFGLEKKVRGVHYSPQRKTLMYKPGPGQSWAHAADNVEPDDLHRHIGKELAEKLLQTPKLNSLPFGGQPSHVHVLEGDDMKVGGGGMNKFYDDIIPKAAMRLAKMHDPNIQPNPAGFSPTGGFSIPVTDELRHGIKSSGFPAFADGGVVGGDMFDYSRLNEVPKVDQFDLPRYEPPRGVSARALSVTSDPNIRDKMHEILTAGERMGGQQWYNADPLRDKFKDVLSSGGEPAFRKFMDLVAATSPRSKVGANVRNASYYYHRIAQGHGAPGLKDKNPYPFGHLAQKLHKQNVATVEHDRWDPLQNPKPASFAENLTGNQMPATIDTHAFRLPGILAKDPRFIDTAYEASKGAPKRNLRKEVMDGSLSMEDALKLPAGWVAKPNDNEYKHMENYYKGLGQERGMTTAQTQAAAWVGGGKLTGLGSDESKPFLRFLEDAIHETADYRNMDPSDVLHSFIRGEIPLGNMSRKKTKKRADGGVVGGGGGDDDLGGWEAADHPDNQPSFPERPGVVDLGERRHKAELTGFLRKMNDDIRAGVQERAGAVADLREAGKLPFDVGTRFHTKHTRTQGQPPYKVVGHYFQPKTGAYGYHVEQGDPNSDHHLQTMIAVHDPKIIDRMGKENFDEHVASYQPLGGLSVAKAKGGAVDGNLKEWFGKSKMIDEDGKPAVWYHSTHRDFTVPDRKISSTWHGDRVKDSIDHIGHWFSDEVDQQRYGPKTVKAHLKIENPLYLDDESWDDSSEGHPRYGKDDVFTKLNNLVKEHGGAEGFREAAKREGHDGVVLSGWLDGRRGNTAIAFEPHQVKHAELNNGDYNIDNPDITKARGGMIGPRPAGLKTREVRGPRGERVLHVDSLGGPPPAPPKKTSDHWTKLALGTLEK